MKWSIKEVKLLKKLYKSHTNKEISVILNRTIGATQTKAAELKLMKPKEYKWHQKKWTKSDDLILKALYPTTSNSILCERLNRKDGSIKNRAHFLGLIKVKNQSFFKTGHKPWNTGMKGLNIGSKSLRTRFKKGNIPMNTVPDGTITIRTSPKKKTIYKYIKLGNKHWELLHRHKWITKNGPVPAGHIIIFRDKDTLNCTLNNLEKITLKENAIRNSGSMKLSDGYLASCISRGSKRLRNKFIKRPDLLDLKRQQIQVNRIIKNRNDEKHNSKTRSNGRKIMDVQQ